MTLSSITEQVFGLCLALHFGFTEEVKEEEKGREDGEEGEEEEKEIDEEEEPSRHNSSVPTPDGWYYNPDADADADATPAFDPTDYGGTPDEFFAALEAAEAVADAARSVCRLRFLLLKKTLSEMTAMRRLDDGAP